MEFHPVALSAETTDLQAGTLTRISRAIVNGTPAAAMSGSLSIYNTFLDYGRALGMTDSPNIDIGQAIRNSTNDGIADYYEENKSAVDIAGFIGTAIIPGAGGVKALQLARSGQATGNVARALNYTASRRDDYLRKALQETADNGGVVKGILQSTSRRGQLRWEIADQALLGTAAELAIIATMNDSPVFDNDSIGDFGWNVALGTVLSGGIGGALGGIAAKGILKEAGRQIEPALRLQDTIFDPKLLSLKKGDEINIMLEGMLTRPDAIDSLLFKYGTGANAKEVNIDLTDVSKRTREAATKQAEQALALKFNELAGGDANVGQAFKDMIFEGIAAAKAAGKDNNEIVELLRGYLQNVTKIDSINLNRMELDKKKFYVNLKPEGEGLDKLTSLFSTVRSATTTKQAYRIEDGVTAGDLSIVNIGDLGVDTLKAAFRAAPEADAIRLADGSVRINPASKNIKSIKEKPYTIRMFLDRDTGTISPETVPVFGDILYGAPVQVSSRHIAAGGREFLQSPTTKSVIGASPLDASARFAWANKLSLAQILKVTGGKIDASDLPLIQRMEELWPDLTPDMLSKFTLVDDVTGPTQFDELIGLGNHLLTKRLEILERGLNSIDSATQAVPEARVIAANLGVNREWVEEAIEKGFDFYRNPPSANARALTTAEAFRPQNIAVTWDFSQLPKLLPEEAYKMNMGPSHLATKELSSLYQAQLRTQYNTNAVGATFGDDAELLIDVEKFLPSEDGRTAAQSASGTGAGATAFGASNASYGERAKLAVQTLGKNVNLLIQRYRDATIEKLSPAINALRDNPRASAELGVLTTALRKSPYRYVIDPTDESRLINADVLRLMKKDDSLSVDDAIKHLQMEDSKFQHSFEVSNPEVTQFLKDTTNINALRRDKLTTLYNTTGLTTSSAYVEGVPIVYVPPINTAKYPFHAFVRTKQQLGLATDTSMITARSEDQLRQMVANLGDDFEVIYKQDINNYYKAKGEYDYGMTLNEAQVNSELARKGVLADMKPETRFDNIMEDWLEWHGKQEEKLVRTGAQVQNRQFFSELEFLSQQYRKVSESVTRGIGSRFKSKVADPFGDYIKTGLDISKQQEFPLLDSLNEFIDKVGLAAGEAIDKTFRSAIKGDIGWQEANQITAKYGLGNPYRGMEDYLLANERYPRNIIREGFQKVNLALANTMLRLDVANSIINTISTPILLGTEMASIKQLIGRDSELVGKLRELTSVKVPGKDMSVPSTTKLLWNSVNNYFREGNKELIKRYQDVGAIKDVSRLFHDMLDDLSYRPTLSAKGWMDKINAGVEKGAKLSGNTMTEEFTRFVSADVMRQLTDPLIQAGKLSVREQDAFISTFVNRVQGNYTTSQRPIIFQGTTGAAISLFQTYAFNVLQQLYRHAELGDKKTLAVFAGLQSTVFGLNGLPFFEAVNTHLIGGQTFGLGVQNNPNRQDAYSVLPQLNKELGEWLLFGTASAFPLFSGSVPALYSRGDINPRHLTVVPTNPLDVPAVSASLKLIDSLTNMAKGISQGGDVSTTLLRGLEHQGWNRPLAGFAQLLAGQSTTSKGALISAANDLQATSWLGSLAERTVEYGGVARLMGARPMDEAVALTTIYRQKTYQAMDRARIERLGTTVKSKLYNGEVPTDEEYEAFLLRYTRSGGRIENFQQAMGRWSRDANVSIVNQLARKNNSHYAQTLQMIMGGEQLPDYRNTPVSLD
jgi:hypothetical protein